MNIASRGFRNTRLVLGLTLTLGAAACAQQAMPQASAPPAADMSIQPAGRSMAMPASSPQGGSMQGMDHSRMPGMSGSSMQGMDHSNMPGMRGGNTQGGGMQGHNMSGMNPQQMMAHCAEMRQQMRPGAAMNSDMQAMMAHCNQMQQGASSGSAGQHRH